MSLNLSIHIIQSEKQKKEWTKRWTEPYGLKGQYQKTKHRNLESQKIRRECIQKSRVNIDQNIPDLV